MKINLRSNFLQLNLRKALALIPQRTFRNHQIEEIAFRLYLCKECFKTRCPYCGCDPLDTATDLYSCNNGEKFPKRHSTEIEWNEFKKRNNIIIE